MTLTLEQVRQTRFHLARRNGYEPVDVDNFVDKVEATLSQLTEENSSLKKQLEAVGSSQPSSIFVPSDSGESDRIRADLQRREAELESVRGELAARTEEVTRNSEELGNVRNELAQAQEALAKAQQDAEALRGEADGLRGEVTELRNRPVPQQAAQPLAPPPAEAVASGTVENIVVTTSAEASPAVTRLLQMATEQAERLVGEAQAESQRILGTARAEAESLIDNANRKAHETLTDARTRADRVESEARVNAEKLTAEAQQRADQINTDVENKRMELFTQLEADRDTLRAKVEHLRSFETNYRSLLTSHLQNQLRTIGDAQLEPSDVPDLMREPAAASATPRLDALLGENHG
ncbi:MAG: DivIVA domain-containing protein [Propionibacteriaceae bacterium]|jgi:DivIVA domain-containing protein|nr:DivIVA domain-containing protein [Propionibacteriaceae bacterium]